MLNLSASRVEPPRGLPPTYRAPFLDGRQALDFLREGTKVQEKRERRRRRSPFLYLRAFPLKIGALGAGGAVRTVVPRPTFGRY